MKNKLLPLLIIGILLSASFSLIIMSHIAGQSHGECSLKTVGEVDCALVQSPIDFVTSHLNALSKFSTAVPVNGFAISLSLLLALAFSILINSNHKYGLLTVQSIFIRSRIRESFVPPNRILFNHWFSLHENSPATPLGRW